MKVFLGGEGPTDLGDWAKEPPYRGLSPELGVIEALMRAVRPDLAVADAVKWKDIRKFRAGAHRSAETRAVLGLALHADEAGCRAVVFSRDRDGVIEREAEVARGIEDARTAFPNVSIAGGLAVEMIESWMLSLHGVTRAEGLTDPKKAWPSAKVGSATVTQPLRVPADATSLTRWLASVEALPK